jgi:predicted nucleotidyltransferase
VQHTRGRQRSIRANTAHFLSPELARIVRKTFGVREPLLQALEPFHTQIEQAFVFGSVAKGTDTSSSDVDLVVVGSAPLMDVAQALQLLESTLGRSVHLSLYDPQEWRSLVESDPVVRQIDQGSKLQLIPDAKTH